jgi:hypothetical protein
MSGLIDVVNVLCWKTSLLATFLLFEAIEAEVEICLLLTRRLSRNHNSKLDLDEVFAGLFALS